MRDRGRRPSQQTGTESILDDNAVSIGNFRLISRFSVDHSQVSPSIEYPLPKDREETETLTTSLGVIINGNFVVATEVFDDSGYPHCLEHLIFNGSGRYPYSDALQRLASHSFAADIDASTELDRTVYTCSAAGEASFLHLLPVYADHILYPRLTASKFLTEIYHFNKNGHDAGKVFNEMKARQTTASDIVCLAYRRGLYPLESGYRNEALGKPEYLRRLKLQKVEDYHRKYYVPHNLCLIVDGRLSTRALLREINRTVEARAIVHRQNQGIRPKGWVRPFVETGSSLTPHLDADLVTTVEFSATEKKLGEVRIVMIGPHPDDHVELQSLQVLYAYLAGNRAAPLRQMLVEIASPQCTSIRFRTIIRANFTEISISLGGVPIRHLYSLKMKVQKALRHIAVNGIDMELMRIIIDNNASLFQKIMESNGAGAFSNDLIQDFLYGDDDTEKLRQSLDVPTTLQSLRNWTNKEWITLLIRYLIKSRKVIVHARPSAELSERLERDEKERHRKRVQHPGPEGLEKQKELLEVAEDENYKPIPEKVVDSIPVLDTDTIYWTPVQSASTLANSSDLRMDAGSDELGVYLAADPCLLPYELHFDSVKSDFITLAIYMSLTNVPQELHRLLHVFVECFLDQHILHEDGFGNRRWERDLISCELDWTKARDYLHLTIKAECSNYDLAIEWARRLLWSPGCQIPTIQHRLARLKKSLPRRLCQTKTVLEDIGLQSVWNQDYLNRLNHTGQLIQWITEIERQIKNNPTGVIENLRRLRDILLDPAGMCFSVRGGVLNVKKPRSAWKQRFRTLEYVPILRHPCVTDSLSALGRKPSRKAFILSSDHVECTRSAHVTLGYSERDHPNVPALLVAFELLTGAEMYIWKQARGTGSSHGAKMEVENNNAHIYFHVKRSSNAHKAFKEARAAVWSLLNREICFERHHIDAAKCAIIYRYAKQHSNPGAMATLAFKSRIYYGRPRTWLQDRVKAVQKVTGDEILAVIERYILPLFNSNTSIAFIACPPDKAEGIAKGFREEGFAVEIRMMDEAVPWEMEKKNRFLEPLRRWLKR